MTAFTGTQASPDSPQKLPLAEAIQHTSLDVLLGAVTDPAISEDLARTLLRRHDLPTLVLERISKNSGLMKYRKVKLALIEHPKTPRHVSLPMIRHLFTFDLMQVSQMPAIAADVKAAANEALINRLETVSLGERLTLARQASGAVAGALLLDKESRVVQAALENSRLTEAIVVKALLRPGSSEALGDAICQHPKWSLRREIRVALLRHEKTPLARVAVIVRSLPPVLLREVLRISHLPEGVNSILRQQLEEHGSDP